VLAGWLLGLVAAFGASADPAAGVTVEPREIDALLANPGMGWQTFHRFADDDPALQGLPSSSAYFRFYWRELEPKDGAIDFARLDGLLARAQRAGQRLCLRVMCTGSGEYMDVPQWLKELGCRGYEFEYEGRPHWVPDFEDPQFQDRHFRLIRELGYRYDPHPELDLVDIGSVGLWGEWHLSGTKRRDTGQPVALPSPATRRAIIDAWRTAFPSKAKVMLIGDIEGLKHAVAHDCGWRADCLGDCGGFSPNWNHMRDLYPLHVQSAGAAEAWRRAPVAFESCWDMRKWQQEGWDVRYIFDYALSNHVSYVNNKSAPIPEGTRGEVERLLRRMGYRLVVRKLRHPASVQPGQPISVTMTWDNVGVAPPYGDYRLAFRLTRLGETARPFVSITPASIRGWLPGQRPVNTSFQLAAEATAGSYELALAVTDPASREPAVRLAITGQTPDGWYPLSRLSVLGQP
jgi:hypothetical protein